MSDISHAIRVAKLADDQFSAAVIAAGFKSRWDAGVDDHPLVRPALEAKRAADRVVHAAFEASRKAERERAA